MVAAAAGILAVGSEHKSTPDAASLVAAAPQRTRPKRKPQGEQAEVKIS